jgi:hypothetical protein
MKSKPMRWSHFVLSLGFALTSSIAVFGVGCSNAAPMPDAGGDAGPTCDDTKCKTGNVCISDGKTPTCRIPCNSNEPSDPTACPANFHCVASINPDGTPKPNTNKPNETLNYCVKDNHVYTQGKGQWGALCNPQKGFDMNPDCDTAASFFCYGTSPTDGDSFCTQFDCENDSDCRMGYWCASINTTPNVTTTARTFGADQVRNVCMPRAWNLKPTTRSAPCKADVDCPLNEGNKQFCVDPGDGKTLMCAAFCKVNGGCTSDGTCADVGRTDKDGNPQLVCIPRAGTIGPIGAAEKGMGGFCSPCHADDDCANGGFCVNAEKSTEIFCTKTAEMPPCKATSVFSADPGACVHDAPGGAASGGIGCSNSAATGFPKDQCVGQVKFMGLPAPACWTAPR